MSAALEEAPGFFGKMPALGDFVQRRLPGSFVKVWDGWLQSAIAGSKVQLGEHWLDTYLSSPVWRFALLPGVCGEQGWAGVIIPSVDRVGRYFPLTVAAPVPPDVRMFGLVEASTWFEQAESTVLSALDEEGFELDGFASAVAGLGACHAHASRLDGSGPLNSTHGGWQLPLDDIADVPGALQNLSELLTRDRFGQFSLWWSTGSELVAPSLLVCPGLPDAQSWSAMLDGRWSESNWQIIGAQPPPPAAGDVAEQETQA